MPIMQTVIQGGGTTPTGTINITANGTYDVTDKASASVAVPTTAPAHYLEYTNVSGELCKGSSTPINLQGISSFNTTDMFNSVCKNGTFQVVGFVNSESLTTVNMDYSFSDCFNNCTNLTTLGLTNITSVSGNRVMYYMCYNCTQLTSTGLGSVQSINGNYCFAYSFSKCTSLTRSGLTNLQSINSNNCCEQAFAYCSNLVNTDLENLVSITASSGTSNSGCCNAMFRNTGVVTVNFNNLTTVRSYCMELMFASCPNLTDIYFPKLRAENTDGTSIFGGSAGNMLSGTTGVTVHFLNSQRATMSQWLSVVGGMGGTNTTVVFDLGINVTVSIPTGYTVYINNNLVHNGDTLLIDEGNNTVLYSSPDGKVGSYIFVATSSTTTFTLDTTQGSYNEFTITSNEASATYSAMVTIGEVAFNINADSNNKIYVTSGATITVYGSATGFAAVPVTQSSDTGGTITLTFVAGSSVTYNSSNILPLLTGDTTYASVNAQADNFIFHYTNSTGWQGSVQLPLTVPSGTTKIQIITRSYASSETNYDFGFISLGTQRVTPTSTDIKAGTIANGAYLFRQSGTTNTMTPVDYETTDATQNVLTFGWGQDSSNVQGTNSLYVEPITVIYYQ